MIASPYCTGNALLFHVSYDVNIFFKKSGSAALNSDRVRRGLSMTM